MISYFSVVYLESWLSWLRGGTQKTLRKRGKQTEEKQNEEKDKRRMQGKSNNNNKHLWFYLLYKKLYFARKYSLKKVVHSITFYLQFLCIAGYWKHNNDTQKPNIHKYDDYNLIEIYINRLNTTTQIFIAMD